MTPEKVEPRSAQHRIVEQFPGLWQSSGSCESWPLVHSLLLHQPSELQLNMQVEPFATTCRREARHAPSGNLRFAANADSSGIETMIESSAVSIAPFAIVPLVMRPANIMASPYSLELINAPDGSQ
jgi:hypothetical protein